MEMAEEQPERIRRITKEISIKTSRSEINPIAAAHIFRLK